MTSGDNNVNYFPENQLTKFIAAPQISMTQRASSPPRMDAPDYEVRYVQSGIAWPPRLTHPSLSSYSVTVHANNTSDRLRVCAG